MLTHKNGFAHDEPKGATRAIPGSRGPNFHKGPFLKKRGLKVFHSFQSNKALPNIFETLTDIPTGKFPAEEEPKFKVDPGGS